MAQGRRGGADSYEVISGGAGNPLVLGGTADPSAGGGVAAPEGSFYMRYVAAGGQCYLKTGAAATAWEALSTGGGATKREIWCQVLRSGVPVDYHYGESIVSGADAEVTISVPFDFGSVDSAKFIAWANSTQSGQDYDLFSRYGAPGEGSSAHTESDNTPTYDGVSGELLALEASSVLTGISAGDLVMAQIENNSTLCTLSVFGLRFVYNVA